MGWPSRGRADDLPLSRQAAVEEPDERFHGAIGQMLQILEDHQVGGPGGSDVFGYPGRAGGRDFRRLQQGHLKVRHLAGDLANEIVDQMSLAGAGRAVQEQRVDVPAGTATANAFRHALHGLPCGTILRQQNPGASRLHVLAFPLAASLRSTE